MLLILWHEGTLLVVFDQFARANRDSQVFRSILILGLQTPNTIG